MTDKQFYVIGGEYADTSFTTPLGTLETHGPYPLEEAQRIWRAKTGQTVDNAMVRYFVKAADEISGDNYYVVGGEYADAAFSKIADGKSLEVHGPYDRQKATEVWRSLTSQSIDSCLHRYDIETR